MALALETDPISQFSLEKSWKKIKNTVKKITRAAKEFGQRFIKMVEMVFCFIGVRPKKYLRLRVHILKDTNGKLAQTEVEVDRWYQEAKRVYLSRANVEVVPATGSSVGSAAIGTIPPEPELLEPLVHEAPALVVGHVPTARRHARRGRFLPPVARGRPRSAVRDGQAS